jgi:hypothetical protein
MRSFTISTTWSVNIRPVLLSNSRPARMAIEPAGCRH